MPAPSPSPPEHHRREHSYANSFDHVNLWWKEDCSATNVVKLGRTDAIPRSRLLGRIAAGGRRKNVCEVAWSRAGQCARW